MAQRRTQRLPEWTGRSRQDVRAIDLPRAGDFAYDENDLDYHGTADPALWYADSWPMCTRGNPQRLRHPVAYSVDPYGFHQIELHIPMSVDELTCMAICQEDLGCVRVRVFICCAAHDWDGRGAAEYSLVPMDRWTNETLGTRRVIDYDTGLELPRRESLWPSRRFAAESCSSPQERSPTPQPPPTEVDISF